MATFEVQVEALTGLSITDATNPTQNELSQFLKDGVIDVTNKIISLDPKKTKDFIRVSAEKTSNTSSPLNLNGAKIISVVREDGVTSDNWRPCREIDPSRQYLVTDSESLDYASKFNPAYMCSSDGVINVFPAPDTGGKDSFKVYYVNNEPKGDGIADDLAYGHTTLGYFPDDKVYLVALYAAIKSLEAKLAEYTIDEEDIELVQALSVNLGNLKEQYNTAFGVMAPKQQAQRGR